MGFSLKMRDGPFHCVGEQESDKRVRDTAKRHLEEEESERDEQPVSRIIL